MVNAEDPTYGGGSGDGGTEGGGGVSAGSQVIMLGDTVGLSESDSRLVGDRVVLYGPDVGRGRSPPLQTGIPAVLPNSQVAQTGLRPTLKLKPPVDIAVTCDNYYEIFFDTVDNLVASETTNRQTGEPAKWESVEQFYDRDFTGQTVIGLKVWNGSEYNNDLTGTTTDSGKEYDPGPWMFCISLRDANGDLFPLETDWTFRIDGRYGEGQHNPYGEDWVRPGFNDSDWLRNRGNDLNISDGWGTVQEDGSPPDDPYVFSQSSFFDSEPHFGNDIPPTQDPRQRDNSDGFYFIRILVEAI